MKKLLSLAVVMALAITGCNMQNDADYASKNISTDAANFKVMRKIIFLNSFTGDVLLTLEGNCAIEKKNENVQLEITCKHGKDDYKKHYLGLSDNTPYLVEQLEPNKADPYHFKIVIKPQSLVPFQNVEIR